jgi:glycosyltransferase involved in cell wall biosynthesis
LLLGNVKEAWSLRKVFRQHPVDVLHINLNGYEVAGVAARMCGIPSIGWHCIMPFRDPSAMRRWLIRWTCRSYSLMGGMSHACVDAWRELSGLPTPRCRMVWNGIDLALYDGPGPVQRLPRDPFVVLAVGRLHPMKGFDVLIRAIGKLNDPRAHLIIAGEGQEKAALTALAVQQPCTDAITFAGHREDMVSMYLAAHCMALPSISHESFGFVLAEAMACGLPLITSDFGPLPEINLHNVTGLVVPAGAPDTLAHAISAIMDNPELGRHFGESGRQRAQECFSRQRMIDEMIKIYISMTHPQGSGLVAGHSSQVRMGQCGEMHYMRR